MYYVHNSNTVKSRCRYLYGTVAVTPYEKQVLVELGLEAGEEPDYSATVSYTHLTLPTIYSV